MIMKLMMLQNYCRVHSVFTPNQKFHLINEVYCLNCKPMARINITIVDATGNKEQQATLPDDASVKRIMEVLLPKMKMPLTGPDGEPLSYKFHHKASGKQLTESQTLAEAGVKEGDVLRLHPEITAGTIKN